DRGTDRARTDDDDVGRVLGHCSLAPVLSGSGSTVGFRPLSPLRLPCRAQPTLANVRDLQTARLYLCVDSRRRQGDLPQFLDAVLGNGVDIVQLREKGLEARDELRLLEVFAAAADRHGAMWAVNDRADLARAAGAPMLHLGQDDLPTPIARQIV